MRRRRFLASPLLLVATRGAAEESLAKDPAQLSLQPAAPPYPRVIPGYRLRFPSDLGAHPAFRSEWWYITGWVRDAASNDLGIQVTFFRNRPRIVEAGGSRFAPNQLLFAHAAVADPHNGKLRHDQRAARAGFGLAEAAEQTTDVRIDDWSLRLDDGKYSARIVARTSGSTYHSRRRSRFCCKASKASRARVEIPSMQAITTASRNSPSPGALRLAVARQMSPASPGSITNGRAKQWPPERAAGTGPASICMTAAR